MRGKGGLFIAATIACAFFLFLGCSAASQETHRDSRKDLLWGFALHGHPVTAHMIDSVTEKTGLPAHFIVFFIQWPETWNDGDPSLPRESLEAIESMDAMPCITWEPMYVRQGEETAIHWKELLEGRYDGYIRAFATEAKTWGQPVMVRFAHEMNLSRYHWGTDEHDYGPESTVIYRKMFRYVVDLFREEHADNVLWVFCPNAESVPGPTHDPAAAWNRIEEYYPGDSYVDILGVDGYNWGATQRMDIHGWDSHWRSFPSIFESAVTELRSINPKKPLFIFETASVDREGDRIDWIAGAVETARAWKIVGIAWFQAEKEADWTLTRLDRDRLEHLFPKAGKETRDRLKGVGR